jgi:hypothetical protein
VDRRREWTSGAKRVNLHFRLVSLQFGSGPAPRLDPDDEELVHLRQRLP